MFPIVANGTWKEILLRGYLYGMGLYVLSCGGADASCEFTCGGPRTTMGVILWALSTVLFPESETSSRDEPISTSQVLDYSCCTLPCLTFFFFFKYGLWVLSSCPQAFKASTSPSELSL